MTPREWETLEQSYESEFGRKMRGKRWMNKFVNLDYQVVQNAFDVHAEESNTAPSIQQVMKHLPNGLVRRARPDHLHAWDELPLSQEMSGMLVWCNTCGAHHGERCGCERCICPHLSARRISKHWYECADCEGTMRAREDDPDVPF